LQRGLSHRQAVILLYAVSAIFALLSLFLPWSTGSTLGLVLAVVGIGVWMGLQNLNYLEFGELRRVAQSTLEQRAIFVNNLSIRRAVEELKIASDFEQICRILEAGFGSNDFDAFELRLQRPPGEFAHIRSLQIILDGKPYLRWRKPGRHLSKDMDPAWSLMLQLIAANNRQRGSLTLYRFHGGGDL